MTPVAIKIRIKGETRGRDFARLLCAVADRAGLIGWSHDLMGVTLRLDPCKPWVFLEGAVKQMARRIGGVATCSPDPGYHYRITVPGGRRAAEGGMRNPPIARAIVADKFGDVLYDSAAPTRWRPGPVRPPIVRRYAPPATPIRPADPASAAVSALVAGLVVALAAGSCLVALALAWGALP